MENKKNGSAVKIIKIKLKSCQAHWLKRQKVKLRDKKSNTSQKKKQSKPVDTMAVKLVIDSITDVFDKEVLSVL